MREGSWASSRLGSLRRMKATAQHSPWKAKMARLRELNLPATQRVGREGGAGG